MRLIEKFFGSEEKATEMQQLDSELKLAIDDIKKLKT